jgi:hypothetical protein
MLIKIMKRSFTGFVYGVAIQQFIIIISCLVVSKPNFVPLVPSYLSHFSSPSLALGVSSVLIGIISAVFSGSSVIFDIEKWSYLKQGLLHFLITTSVWLPVSIFLWGMLRYQQAIVNVFLSFSMTYAVTWAIQYVVCKKNIQEINQKLKELNQ